MIERRYLAVDESEPLEIEERSGAAPKIRGRAIVYNSRSKDLGGFTEIIEPGAFDHILARQRPRLDVVALWNHEPSGLLGRTTSGTLKLIPDERGVAFELDPPDTTLGRDLMTLCRRGDVAGCSFAFTVEKGGERVVTDEEGNSTRYISRASGLYDVSLVTNPAYGATSLAVRSLQDIIGEPAAETPEPQPLEPADRLNLAKARAWAAIRSAAKVLVLLVAFVSVAQAGETCVGPCCAQGVANENARAGRLRHLGSTGGCYEGLGMASTQQGAYNACCFANRSDLDTVDVGYAQTTNGRWICCRRYRPRSR